MSRDPYKSYFDMLRRKDTEQANKEYKPVEQTQANSSDSSDQTVKILQEISNKLDKLGETENNIQVEHSVQSQGEIDLAIINGKVVLPDTGVINTNIYIKGGVICSLGTYPPADVKEVIDARDRYVIPGVIDPHVHLGLFAPLKTELVTETKAALLGGVTTIGCYFGGPESHFKVFPSIMEDIQNHSYTDIIPHLVIGSDEQKREIVDYTKHFGITSFKVYMNGIPGLIPDVDDGFIMDVMDEIKRSGRECILCSHTENRYLVRRAFERIKQEKGDSANIRDWTDTHPAMAEEEAVMRLAYLAEKAKVPVYMVHVSSKAAIDRLRSIKPYNRYVNVETTSPYLSMTRDSFSDNTIKMEPPFRDREDLEALWEAVEDGLVDTIGTDNVTLTRSEKKIDASIWDTVPGYAVLETHLSILLHEGVIKRNIPIEKLISRVTKNPAEKFNVYPRKGTISPGSDADIVIVDLNLSKEIKAQNLSSRSDFSIYENRIVKGWPIATIKAGKLIVRDGEFVAGKSSGVCINR